MSVLVEEAIASGETVSKVLVGLRRDDDQTEADFLTMVNGKVFWKEKLNVLLPPFRVLGR